MNKVSKSLIFMVFMMILFFSTTTVSRAATITVNSSADNTTCDDVITYREAFLLANGAVSALNRVLTTREKDQISGANFLVAPRPSGCPAGTYWIPSNWIGSDLFDTIKFDNSVGVINIGASFPAFFWWTVGDEVNGRKPDGSKVILDGTNAGASAKGIALIPARYNILNLEIRNFAGDGIFCQSCDNSVFRGLVIHHNGGHGIHFVPLNATYEQSQAVNNSIGGTGSDQGNVIFSNGGDGIRIEADLNFDRNNENILILNNLIGTSDGTNDNGNGGRGISLFNTFGVTIGDATGATRNVISGNDNDGIALIGSGAVSNLIINNFIGTNSAGTMRLGNTASGIALLNDAGDGANFVNSFPNRIGQPGRGNVISANNFGIFIADPNTSNNIVQSNLIGTNAVGTLDLGNNGDGIYITNGTFDNQIGGTLSGEDNLISFNGNGIKAVSGVRNLFRRNRITRNDNMGIDLLPVGFTPNDTGDGDSGPNNLQNFPVITYVNAQSNSITIQGSLNSTPNQTYTIELFGNAALTATGFGEGQNFLGSTQITTNSSGNATFNKTIAVSLSNVGSWITATATDQTNNTSEYSLARSICADPSIPSAIIAYGNGGTSSFTVTNAPGCTFTAQSLSPWMEVTSVSGSTVNFRIFPNAAFNQRNGTIGVYVPWGNFTQLYLHNVYQVGGGRKPFFDFDGDMKTDISIFRPTGNLWQYVKSTNGQTVSANFGQAGDRIVPADYTGDGRTDIAVFRPSDGNWYILPTGSNTAYSFHWGASGDIPAPGDFDYDGKADAAVYRPSDLKWYIVRSSDGVAVTEQFGIAVDIPQVNDYDGDGKADIAVFRPTDGSWWIKKSSNGQVFSTTFGIGTDKPVAADYTGDGKADLAVWRPSTGVWYVLKSEDLATVIQYQYGVSGDIPVAGDYDGDGKADFAIFHPATSQWYLQRTTAGSAIYTFGAPGDKPVPAAFVP